MGASRWVGAAAAVAMLLAAPSASATRAADPPAVDFGTIVNGPAGGRLSRVVLYSISADETNRYAYNRAGGGAPDGSTQFSVGGGDCFSVFPPLPLTPASCTIVVQFDYASTAKGLSTGALVIDADANYSTPADQTIVPLQALISGGTAGVMKRKCRKKRRHRSASAAKKRKCKKRRKRRR